ncbi:MAG TPA: hypothetical protein DEA96_05600 [Leptospiraceae bacterium]|nr:hypothetical protein [Spirochaetaceae bacterium]HBS04417.1 hypothetical protein [Leptospiraceae bacterium]|tara:strand:- start:11718 stop:11939 length:222 start_codon:yes stop_codon:yes gene_type:complete
MIATDRLASQYRGIGIPANGSIAQWGPIFAGFLIQGLATESARPERRTEATVRVEIRRDLDVFIAKVYTEVPK